jgi:Holin of 3TMs, for gene-transfer release
MITLLGALLGFIGSLFPELFKQVSDWRDKQHELKLLELQMQQAANQNTYRMAEIETYGDIETSKALYTTWKTDVPWVDALNGTVRPVIAYAFFALYASLKLMQFSMLDVANPLPWQLAALWNEEDQAIFAGIISFYFGSRAMKKAGGR